MDPVPTAGLTMDDVPQLVARVRATMEAAYKELSKEVISALPPDYPLANSSWSMVIVDEAVEMESWI